MTVDASRASVVRGEDLSPELVLVDPALAALARDRLEGPGDTLAEIESTRRTRLETVRSPSVASSSSWDPRSRALRRLTDTNLLAPSHESSDTRVRPRLRVVAIAAAMPAVVLLAALASSSWLQTSESRTTDGPTAAGATTVEEGRVHGGESNATDTRSLQTPRPSNARAPGDTPFTGSQAPERRLAWAPAPDASEYRVELFRGSSLVFSADTTSTALVLPASWRIEGRRQRLVPGEYRWYVWPLVEGRRGTQAIVQARLDVGG